METSSIFSFLTSLSPIGLILFTLIVIAVIILKGFALWHSARIGHKWWFIILLVVNTVGILELIYLYAVAKIWKKDPSEPAPTPTDL